MEFKIASKNYLNFSLISILGGNMVVDTINSIEKTDTEVLEFIKGERKRLNEGVELIWF